MGFLELALASHYSCFFENVPKQMQQLQREEQRQLRRQSRKFQPLLFEGIHSQGYTGLT